MISKYSRSCCLAALWLLVGCAGEQPPRNAVQHSVLSKEDLVGVDGKAVWYYLQTVIDVPYSTGFTFTGEQSLLEKVRWDIQEKILYARRAYEFMPNTDSAGGGTEQGSDPRRVIGAPIAAFTIEKHFDVVRDYNPATGEEINKLIENDTDRRWYERRFMRVDWSKNLIADYQFLTQFGSTAVAPLRQEPVPYYVSNPADPDAVRLSRPAPTVEDPRPTASYLEITSKLMVTPEQVSLSFVDGEYQLPACYLAEDFGPDFANADCSAQEIKLRHSFMRATRRDYDPLVYDDRWMERFGYFSTERQAYDPQYQETETGRIRLANRFNIWNKTLSAYACSPKQHYKPLADPQRARDAAQAGADAACAGKLGAGSSCASVAGRCTLPPGQREGLKKIVYYLNVGFPATLIPTAGEVIGGWNDVLQTTAARLLHPGDNPRDDKLLAQRKQSMGAVFELRENDCNNKTLSAFVQRIPEAFAALSRAVPAATTLPLELVGKDLLAGCSAVEQATTFNAPDDRFTWQRIGDLRYSMLYWIGVPTREGLLGYGPSAADPETGELIQGNAFLYGAQLDSYTARATDIVGLMNCRDEACVQRFAQGVPIKDWVATQTAVGVGSGARARTHTSADVATMHGQMKLDWTKALNKSLPPLEWKSFAALRASRRARRTALAGSTFLGQGGKTTLARLAAIKGTALEVQAREQLLAASGLRSGARPLPAKASASLSSLDWAGPALSRARKKALMRLAARRVELASFFDNAVLGTALRYKEAGKTREQIFSDLRSRLLRGLAEHEVGHTLGLRHNFAGSYDAMNYQPGYWRLRQTDSAGALPRYKKAYNDAELRGNAADPAAREGLAAYQYSTVMDYGGKFNSDIVGLGYYDRAAIKFGYGQLVEVFDRVGPSVPDRYLLANTQTSMRWGEPLLFTISCDGNNYRSVHYTEYPRLVGGVDNLGRANRIDVPLSTMATRKLSEVAPGCAVYQWGALWDSDVPVDKQGRLEVPFRFCSDEFEGASPECSAFDLGADVFEVVDNAIESYHNYYIFHNLKLDRLGFGLWGYTDRIWSRYIDPLRSSMQFYVLNRGDLSGDTRNASFLGDTDLEAFFKADDGYGPWTVATDRAMNFLLGILATPEPGKYWVSSDGKRMDQLPRLDAKGNDKPEDLNLEVPQGKAQTSTWDFDSGYFWYDKMTRVGVFHDKLLALWALTDPETFFIARDTAADLRQYAINFYRLYPDLLSKVMRGVMTDDWQLTAHYAVPAKKQLVSRDFTFHTAAPAGALPINPQPGFSARFYASLLGVALIPRTYDTSFLDSCRVWVKGATDEITPAATPSCFVDKVSSKQYCAVSNKDSKGTETGIGAALIARASALQAAGDSPEAKLQLMQVIDQLDLLRSVTKTFAYTPY